MTARRGPIVIDTDVFSADLSDTTLITVYEPIIVGRPAFLSFQTVAELRYGALRRGWSTARVRKVDAKIATAEVVHSGDELVAVYAQLRADCVRFGHALGQRDHDATGGSPPPPSALRSHSCRTTGSLRTRQASNSNRPTADHQLVGPRAHHVRRIDNSTPAMDG